MSKQTRVAKEAIRKLRIARELNASVYIFGATGFGKSSSVAHVFDKNTTQWISCDNPEYIIQQKLRECDPAKYVVVDDLHLITNSSIHQEIIQMILNQEHHMILIGRAATPMWLSQLVLQSRMLIITEDDLRVTEDELSDMCDAAGLELPPERLRSLIAESEGNAMVLDLFVRQSRQAAVHNDEVGETVRKVFMAYLEDQVISHWSRDIQDFLMQVCVVDTFTPELAEYITGEENIDQLLSRAETVGNILSCTNGIWRIRPVLLETLRARTLKTFGRRRYEQLLYNAGRYYEKTGDTLQALTIFTQCNEPDSIHALLVREARKHPGAGNYWNLRRYYQGLSDQEIADEPVLMAAVSILYSILMDTEKSEYWYNRLKEYSSRAKGNDRADAIYEIAYLDVALPHRGTKDLISIFKSLPGLIKNNSTVLRPVSLTNNQPSVMNGGKDFCEWSKTDVLLARTIGPLVEKLLGKTGIGLTQIAMGESTYEKGGDHFQTLSYLTKGQNQSESSGTIEMTWVSIALQAKLCMCTGDSEYARRLIDGMLRRAECEHNPHLAESVRAFKCWIALYTNETGSIHEWMESAPDETIEFCTLNRYLYMIKIYCYIALGEHMSAVTLIQRMLAYAEYSDRKYILMDCGLLNAIIMRRTGQPWKEDLVRTFRSIADYGFTRIISEKGPAILPLLNDLKNSFCQSDPQHGDWFERVMKETVQMARRYPVYLRGSDIDLAAFSDTALQVLRLQAAGYTTGEIAEQLHITQRTVKYHAAENYKKLDAKNLVDAVQIAQALNIL